MSAERVTRPVRILMTTDAVGGVWQYTVDLLTALGNEDFDVLLATLGPRPTDKQRTQITGLRNVKLLEGDFALEWMENGEADFERSSEWLLDLRTAFHPDIVHLNGYGHAVLPWGVPCIVVAHSCVFSWWRAVHGEAPPPGTWQGYYQTVSNGLSRASRVVAPSCTMAHCLEAEYPGLRQKPAVIHNFSSIPPFPADHAHRAPVCLAAGRLWDQAKNMRLLEDVAGQIDWPLRLAGEKGLLRGSTAPRLGFELLGKVSHSELLVQMRESSLFLHPALYEPFGLSVLEAARSGCCLVLADIASLRELWHDSAVFVSPRNPQAWIVAVQSLIQDTERRQQLGARALRHSLQYCAENTIPAYRSLYHNVPLDSGCQSHPAHGAAA